MPPLPLGGGGRFLLVSAANLEKPGEGDTAGRRTPAALAKGPGPRGSLAQPARSRWRPPPGRCPPHPVSLSSLRSLRETALSHKGRGGVASTPLCHPH